jgi:predicted PurR-regulated permease PerM
LLGLVLLLVGGAWLVGASAAEQLQALRDTLPQAMRALREWLAGVGWGRWLLAMIAAVPFKPEDLQQMAGLATGTLNAAVGAVGAVVLVLALGIYLAADISLYRRGALRLVPPAQRALASTALEAAGRNLSRWLVGQGVTMLAVGALTAAGLALIGMPLVLSLSLIAALLEFVPYFGPVATGVLVVSVALTVGEKMALWALLVCLAVQQVEAYVVQPLAQRWAVRLPPVLGLVAVLVFGVLFGLPGVLLAVAADGADDDPDRAALRTPVRRRAARPSAQAQQIGRDGLRVGLADPGRGHRAARVDALRVADPGHQVLARVRQAPRDLRAPGEPGQRRSDMTLRADDARNHVAALAGMALEDAPALRGCRRDTERAGRRRHGLAGCVLDASCERLPVRGRQLGQLLHQCGDGPDVLVGEAALPGRHAAQPDAVARDPDQLALPPLARDVDQRPGQGLHRKAGRSGRHARGAVAGDAMAAKAGRPTLHDVRRWRRAFLDAARAPLHRLLHRQLEGRMHPLQVRTIGRDVVRPTEHHQGGAGEHDDQGQRQRCSGGWQGAVRHRSRRRQVLRLSRPPRRRWGRGHAA